MSLAHLQNILRAFPLALVLALSLSGCQERVENPNKNLTLEAFDGLDTMAYKLSSERVRQQVERLSLNDSDSTWADARVRTYYLHHGKLLWVNRRGVDSRVDTVLVRLKTVGELGFSEQKFCVPQIERDLQRWRNLDFDDSANTASRVLGRLEYHLSKGYLRYVAGQRFGFVNPNILLNRLDVHSRDSNGVTYQRLFDLPVQRAGMGFFVQAFHKVSCDSLEEFFNEVQPQGSLYAEMLHLLHSPEGRAFSRQQLMVNLERSRWRLPDYPQNHKKYVLVNIPAFKLMAVDGSKVLSMKIGCGTLLTKTPLLMSQVKRMDVNPQWILPKSIIKKSVIRHAGNRYYFKSHHFFVRERATGKIIAPGSISSGMLLSGNYLVIQEGGKGNALGRVIFRFDNDFSVYLHSTSQPGVFSREDRGVSHGCVRVERPYELAVFMLDKKDPEIMRKIAYSMQADVSPLGKAPDELTAEEQAVADTLQRKLLVGNIDVMPRVPLYIFYFTLYPNPEGKMQAYDDVYGYDEVMFNYLRNFM